MAKEIERVEPDNVIDPRLERIVWRGLGKKSVRQMAEETGLEPEQIFAIKRELLSAVDVLTVQEKRHKLLIELEELSDEARDRAKGTIDEYFSGMMNSSVAAMKTILVELNRIGKGEQEAIERLNAKRVSELLRLIDRTVALTLAEIAETHELEEAELQAVFQKHLVPAAEELDSGVAG